MKVVEMLEEVGAVSRELKKLGHEDLAGRLDRVTSQVYQFQFQLRKELRDWLGQDSDLPTWTDEELERGRSA